MKPTQLNDGMKITWSQESANIGTLSGLVNMTTYM